MEELCKYSYAIGVIEIVWVCTGKVSLNQANLYIEALAKIEHEPEIDLLNFINKEYGLSRYE